VKQIFLTQSLALALLPAAAFAMPRTNEASSVSPSSLAIAGVMAAAASPSAAAGPAAPQDPSNPSAPAPLAPVGPALPSSPAGPSAAAVVQPLDADQALSPTAADTVQAEEVAPDQSATAQTAPADLDKLDSPSLARLARNLGLDAPTVWWDPDQQQPLAAASDGAQSVDAAALYAALLQRSQAGDKDARQALAMARLRGDARAQPTATAAPDTATAQALGLSPSAAADLAAQALSAAAQALGLSPSAAPVPASATAR